MRKFFFHSRKFSAIIFPRSLRLRSPPFLLYQKLFVRIEMQTLANQPSGGGKTARAVESKDVLLLMPVCDELSVLHKEGHLMQKEIQSMKNDRLVSEIECINRIM